MDMSTTERRRNGWFDAYAGFEGPAYCEVFEGPGRARDPWRSFLDTFTGMDEAVFLRRQAQAERMLREHGATYNLFGDPEELDRPWELDLIPFLLPAGEWTEIEAGLRQRARLLDRLLADLHGAQRIVKDGILPPELVFANPGFHRPCHGTALAGRPFLAFYAADMCRSASGKWCVLRDRTQTPTGPGFALENRIILSQALPGLFRRNRVLRLAPFFSTLQAHLAGTARRNRENPGIVVLSSGPSSETYFEHAFLARYLGYPLVESGDLTVRDHQVFLKTLGGLEPVDVIFRRIADRDCDPLALRGDASLGVAGLIHAARRGGVSVVNPVGTGLAESAGISAHLPGLSEHLLGEPLALPGWPSLWLGNEASRETVLGEMGRYAIWPAFDGEGDVPLDADALPEEERQALVERVLASPQSFVAWEKGLPSAIPSWQAGGLVPEHAVLRFYVTATPDGDYAVMPGGLVRVSRDPSALLAPGGEGGRSKDLWVLSEKPVTHVSLLRRLEKVIEISRGSDLPSRVADHLLWLGRYVERAEGLTRLLRSLLKRLSGETAFTPMPELPVLLRMAEERDLVRMDRVCPGGRLDLDATQEGVLAAIFSRDVPGSLADLLARVHRSAAHVRDRLSLDAWRILVLLEEDLHEPDSVPWIQVSEASDLLTRILTTLSAFSGFAMESMTRGLGWRFMDMGRRIDRAEHVVRLVRSSLGEDAPTRTPPSRRCWRWWTAR